MQLPWDQPSYKAKLKRKKATKKKAKKKKAAKKLPLVRRKKTKKKAKKVAACALPSGKPTKPPKVTVGRAMERVPSSVLAAKVPKKCKTRKPPKKKVRGREAEWPECQSRPRQRERWEQGKVPGSPPRYVPGRHGPHGAGSVGDAIKGKGMPNLNWFVGPEAGARAGKIVVAFSGGKDSLACLLYAIEACIQLGLEPGEVIDCFHYSVDGRPWFFGGTGENSFDWPVTEDYCLRVCACLGIPVYFGWRMGGLMGEVLKGSEDDPLAGIWERATGMARPTPPMYLQMPDGSIDRTGGEAGKLYVRRGFPAKSASLQARWCTPLAKIDVGRAMINNRLDFASKRVLLITGERAEESTNRSSYDVRQFESGHGSAPRTGPRHSRVPRHVEQWRPIHKWCEIDVWAIIARWQIRPHPAYRLGWGRLSCMTCIFGSDTMWASVRAIDPARFERFAAVEGLLSDEKEEGVAWIMSLPAAELKREALSAALEALGAQEGFVKPEIFVKMRKKVDEAHRSGALAKKFKESFTLRIPLIDKGKPLEQRTQPRWRKAKKVETAAIVKSGSAGLAKVLLGGGEFRIAHRAPGAKGKLEWFEVFDPALPFPQAVRQRRLVNIALSHKWREDPIMSPWRLPAGAFGESSGPS